MSSRLLSKSRPNGFSTITRVYPAQQAPRILGCNWGVIRPRLCAACLPQRRPSASVIHERRAGHSAPGSQHNPYNLRKLPSNLDTLHSNVHTLGGLCSAGCSADWLSSAGSLGREEC